MDLETKSYYFQVVADSGKGLSFEVVSDEKGEPQPANVCMRNEPEIIIRLTNRSGRHLNNIDELLEITEKAIQTILSQFKFFII